MNWTQALKALKEGRSLTSKGLIVNRKKYGYIFMEYEYDGDNGDIKIRRKYNPLGLFSYWWKSRFKPTAKDIAATDWRIYNEYEFNPPK